MALSDEDLALLRRGYDLFNAEQFDEALELLTEDFTFERDGVMEPVRGHAALREFWEPDAFEWQRLEPGELQVAGDKVLVRVVMRAKGAGSSIELSLPQWHVWTIENDRAAHLLVTLDEPVAREAAGLV